MRNTPWSGGTTRELRLTDLKSVLTTCNSRYTGKHKLFEFCYQSVYSPKSKGFVY